MKRLKPILFLLLGMILLSGCRNETQSTEGEMLVDRLLQDYQTYFNQTLDLSDYSIGGYKPSGLMEKEAIAPTYLGERVGLVLDRAPKKNEVQRLAGEYKDGELLGIRYEVYTESSIYQEDSLEYVAVSFLSQHDLATQVSLIDVTRDGNDVVYRFEDMEQQIIKVYVNEDIRQVVGFLLNNGVDL